MSTNAQEQSGTGVLAGPAERDRVLRLLRAAAGELRALGVRRP
jgi:hypothetical protein